MFTNLRLHDDDVDALSQELLGVEANRDELVRETLELLNGKLVQNQTSSLTTWCGSRGKG